MVQNASRDAVLKLQRSDNGVEWGLYAIASLAGYRLLLTETGNPTPLLDESVNLAPCSVRQGEFDAIRPARLTLTLKDTHGIVVLAYEEHQPGEMPLPEVATAPAAAENITSADEAWFIGQHLEQYNHASRSAFDYYIRGVAIDPLDYRCNLALATLEYNRADYPRAVEYATQALARAHRLNKNPQCGQASFIRASALERQQCFPEAKEDFWRATWSGNSKAAGFYGLARLAARELHYPEGIEFCRQSLRACPTNQDVLCLQVRLLQLSSDAEEAKANLQTLRHDYPLNPTVWWLQWQSEGSDEALNAWRDICGGRDINALLTAGQLLSWGMKTEAIGVLEKLACERTLPLLLQASLLTESDRAPLIARAIDAFPRFVRFPIRWMKWMH
jgi:tetratricopeptide (TPR) repeat protein